MGAILMIHEVKVKLFSSSIHKLFIAIFKQTKKQSFMYKKEP